MIERLVAMAFRLYLSEMAGGPSRLRRFDPMGGNARDLPVSAGCGVMDLIALADPNADGRTFFFNQLGMPQPKTRDFERSV